MAALDPDRVAGMFVEHYYKMFDTQREALANLYQDHSMLTFEGAKIQGVQGIMAKLTSLPFQACEHVISQVDCQPSGYTGGMVVFVVGTIKLPGEDHALRFTQERKGFAVFAFMLESINLKAPQIYELMKLQSNDYRKTLSFIVIFYKEV